MRLYPTQRLQGGRFVLLGLLKAGGEAEVWRALDTERGAERALKVYPAGDGGAEAAARELALARRLAHAHVVRVEDAFVEGEHAFVVMELAEGSLADRVATLGPLTPAEAVAALDGPLRALAEAHAQGVVHRDLKPHNLLVFGELGGRLGEGGTATVKLADFGIAQLRAEGVTRTRSGALLGSLPFMSPEQRRDPKRVGPATDVYAAAVTLAWLLLGEAPDEPWTEDAQRFLRARGVPEGMVEVIARAGARRVEERFGEAGELRAAVSGVLHSHDPGAPKASLLANHTTTPSSPTSGGASWTRTWVLTGSALTLGILATVGATRFGAEVGSAVTVHSRTDDGLPPCPDAPRIWNRRVRQAPRETVGAAVADVDEDGRLDIVFNNQQDESLSIWRAATGGGVEGEPTIVLAGRSEDQPLVIDHDDDGYVDVILALKDDSAFGVLRGRGDGTFHPMEKVFQGPPPVKLHWLGSSRRLLFGTTSGQLELRDVALRTADWGNSRGVFTLDGWSPTTFLRAAGGHAIALGGAPLTAVEFDAKGRGVGSQALPQWPPLTTPIAADLLEPHGEDELYGVTLSGQLLRHDLRDGRATCTLGGRLTGVGATFALVDLNADGIVDVVGAKTCAGCTSNQIVWMGGR